MSIIKQPLNPGHGGRSDDLDGLLREFYRAELPEPWPTLKPPAEPTPRLVRPAPRRWAMNSSRWALAASVALLLIGQLVLSGKFSDYAAVKSEGEFRPPTADPHRVTDPTKGPIRVEKGSGSDGKVGPNNTNSRR